MRRLERRRRWAGGRSRPVGPPNATPLSSTLLNHEPPVPCLVFRLAFLACLTGGSVSNNGDLISCTVPYRHFYSRPPSSPTVINPTRLTRSSSCLPIDR